MRFEKPVKTRAIFRENGAELTILLPAKKYWFQTAFFTLGLCCWLFCGIGATYMLVAHVSNPGNEISGGLIITWILLYIFVLIMPVLLGGYSVLWNLFGRETITIDQGELVAGKWLFFPFRTVSFDLTGPVEINVIPEEKDRFVWLHARGLCVFTRSRIIIRSGMNAVRFGRDLEEVEARYLIGEMQRKLPTFSSGMRQP